MLNTGDRIESLSALGDWLRASLADISDGKKNDLEPIINRAGIENGWFTKEAVVQSLEAIVGWLTPEKLNEWTGPYYISDPGLVKKVAVIMAGNIPLVNFHDFLCVLVTGHQFMGKLSSQDKVLLPFLADKLIEINTGWKEHISFNDGKLDGFDAVIATGSNNTSRYFSYYFEKYPHIIRKNRHSLAILNGSETDTELLALYEDIFQYYGMGCRNVSMLWVPQGYNFPGLFDKWGNEPLPTDHNKYKNNYDYYRSFYLVNQQPFFDTGYLSVLKNDTITSPISVVHYMEYADIKGVESFVKTHRDSIQCVVSNKSILGINTILPGETQKPQLTDYPDGVDVIQFLLAL
jgi:hypothetical protein